MVSRKDVINRLKQKLEDVKADISRSVSGGSAGQIQREIFGKQRNIDKQTGEVEGFKIGRAHV